MTNDLVKQLRHEQSLLLPESNWRQLTEQAADRIEALKKERDEWKLRTMAAMHFVPDNVTFGEIRNIRAALAGEKKDG